MKEKNIAILVVGYKRPQHLENAILSIKASGAVSEDIPVYVSVDGVKDGDAKKYLNEETQAAAAKLKTAGVVDKLLLRSKNLGTLQNMTRSISEVLARHDNVVVLEDDLVLTKAACGLFEIGPNLLKGKVSAVSAYSNKSFTNVPFLSRRFNSQGWMTNRAFWTDFDYQEMRSLDLDAQQRTSVIRSVGRDLLEDFDAFQRHRLDSWAVPWNIHNFLKNQYMVYPPRSLVENFSHEEGAERTQGISFPYEMSSTPFSEWTFSELTENTRYLRHFSYYSRLKRRLRSIVG